MIFYKESKSKIIKMGGWGGGGGGGARGSDFLSSLLAG